MNNNYIYENGKKICGVEPFDKSSYFEYEFKDWESFISVFDVNTSELFKNGFANKTFDMLYRGHEDKDWKLLPNAYRALDSNQIRTLRSGNGHWLSEQNDLKNFILGMNAIHLHIEPHSFNFAVTEDYGYHFGDFAHDSTLKYLAIAQHYGVKTRLLDFTLNPLVALFFATEAISENSNNDGESGHFGIWVIPKYCAQDDCGIEKVVDIIAVNGFQNRNLIAQKGVFVNYIKERACAPELFEGDEIKSLDQYLLSKDTNIKPMLFTLSHNFSHYITKHLDNLNINWTTIQPDLDGVKKEVERKKRKI